MTSKDFRFGISSSAEGLDLNQLLLPHPVSCFFMRVAEDLPELELTAGDMVIVDRARQPKTSELVVLAEAGIEQLAIVRWPVQSEAQLWGVVVHLIRDMKQ